MTVHEEYEALKAWVSELFNHAGIHHSMRAVPVNLAPAPAEKPAEEPKP